jgi:hypothetical protein
MKNNIEWWVAGMPDGSEMNSVTHGSIESVHAAAGVYVGTSGLRNIDR